jgi:hypothetical protein
MSASGADSVVIICIAFCVNLVAIVASKRIAIFFCKRFITNYYPVTTPKIDGTFWPSTIRN